MARRYTVSRRWRKKLPPYCGICRDFVHEPFHKQKVHYTKDLGYAPPCWNRGLTKNDPRVLRSIQGFVASTTCTEECNCKRHSSSEDFKRKHPTLWESGSIPWNKGLTKQDLRVARTSNNHRRSTTSKGERALVWALSEFFQGYPVIFQKTGILGRPDIFIPHLNLCIFFDGCWWHSCPTCKIPTIRKEAEQDRKRDAHIIHSLSKDFGYSVWRFWEHEFKLQGKIGTYVSQVKHSYPFYIVTHQQEILDKVEILFQKAA